MVIIPRRTLMLGFGAAGIGILPKTPWAAEVDASLSPPPQGFVGREEIEKATSALPVPKSDPVPLPNKDVAQGEEMPSASHVPSRDVPNSIPGRPWSLAIVAPYARSQENIIYRLGPYYSRQAVQRLSILMRDWHVQQARWINPRLFDILAWLQEASGSDEPITLTSGFRSLQTQLRLFPNNLKLAYNSPHIRGLAADIRIAGVPDAWIRDAALALKVGGVGSYPNARFVHVDAGPVRYWVG